jgi:hypothetical protein
MRISAKTLWLGCAALVLCLRLAAQEAPKISCPETVPLASPQLAKPIEGWNVFFDTTPHRLSRVTFFDGTVAESASLVPDEDTRLGRTRTAKWLLQAKPERPYWLACYYSGTSLALSRALPAGLKECDVTYNPSVEIDGMPEIKSIACK